MVAGDELDEHANLFTPYGETSTIEGIQPGARGSTNGQTPNMRDIDPRKGCSSLVELVELVELVAGGHAPRLRPEAPTARRAGGGAIVPFPDLAGGRIDQIGQSSGAPPKYDDLSSACAAPGLIGARARRLARRVAAGELDELVALQHFHEGSKNGA
jgi:hypothetical protein